MSEEKKSYKVTATVDPETYHAILMAAADNDQNVAEFLRSCINVYFQLAEAGNLMEELQNSLNEIVNKLDGVNLEKLIEKLYAEDDSNNDGVA